MKIILATATFLIITLFMSFKFLNKTERQKYELIEKREGFEIRFYPKAILATVESPSKEYMQESNSNFRRLANYIFGGNKSSNQIAMTAPVHMNKNEKGSSMSFVMPSNYKMEDLPQPLDKDVKLHYSEEGYYAVVKFGGYANSKDIRKKESELSELLKKSGVDTIGNFSYLGYNAPWDFINRENEVLIKIKFEKS